jgi:hypothetical protein
MTFSPRARLAALAGLFLVPIAASLLVYHFFRPEPAANYGELLLPPDLITTHEFARADGTAFAFSRLRGRWILVASDSGRCEAACVNKLAAMRQVRLALGRNAGRVERVFVVDDIAAASAPLASQEGVVVLEPHRGVALPPGALNDRAHIYLVDPLGNVMMRWPEVPDLRRMLKDLDRLLRASQVG